MKLSEKRLEEHIPLSGSTAPKDGEGMTLSPHQQQSILVLRPKPKPSVFDFLTKSLLFRGCFRQAMRTEGGRQKKKMRVSLLSSRQLLCALGHPSMAGLAAQKQDLFTALGDCCARSSLLRTFKPPTCLGSRVCAVLFCRNSVDARLLTWKEGRP